jgi:hypothetical protein
MKFFTYEDYFAMLNHQPNDCVILQQSQQLSFLQELFIFTGVIQFSFFIAFVLTSMGIHYIDWDYFLPTPQPKKEPRYTEKYPLKIFMDKEERTRDQVYEQSTETNNHNYVMESTPNGLVVMRHNFEDRVFEYFADKNITYMTLETVARKYCNIFGVPEIFLGDTFVDYIYDSDLDSESESDEEQENTSQLDESEKETKEDTKEPIKKPVMRERNTYRLMGMVREFDIGRKEDYKDIGEDKEKQKMTFEMFRQMISGGGSS